MHPWEVDGGGYGGVQAHEVLVLVAEVGQDPQVSGAVGEDCRSGAAHCYLGGPWLTDVLAGWLLAAAWLTLLFTSLRLLGPAPRDRGSPRTAATATDPLDIIRDDGGQPLGNRRP